jgi:hypothetical protein
MALRYAVLATFALALVTVQQLLSEIERALDNGDIKETLTAAALNSANCTVLTVQLTMSGPDHTAIMEIFPVRENRNQ